MKKKTSFTDKSKEELTKLLGEKRTELRTLRFEAAGARAKDTNTAGTIRKDIARIMTALSATKA